MTNPPTPFCAVASTLQVIRLVVMLYGWRPASVGNIKDLLFERGIDVLYETVRKWGDRFGLVFAGQICSNKV